MTNKIIIDNLNYMINQIKNNLNICDSLLNNELYFELTKEEIIQLFNDSLTTLNKWLTYYNDGNIDLIKNEYKYLEGNISELEVCLVEFDSVLKCGGISYSLYEVGKVLLESNEFKED